MVNKFTMESHARFAAEKSTMTNKHGCSISVNGKYIGSTYNNIETRTRKKNVPSLHAENFALSKMKNIFYKKYREKGQYYSL